MCLHSIVCIIVQSKSRSFAFWVGAAGGGGGVVRGGRGERMFFKLS